MAIRVKCQNVPDLTCRMTFKVADMLLAIAHAYAAITLTPIQLQLPNIYYDLSQYLSKEQIMNMYAPVIHLPARYITTFEEGCYTGFFEYTGADFSPYERYVNTRFARYKTHLTRVQIV